MCTPATRLNRLIAVGSRDTDNPADGTRIRLLIPITRLGVLVGSQRSAYFAIRLLTADFFFSLGFSLTSISSDPTTEPSPWVSLISFLCVMRAVWVRTWI